MSRFVVEIIVSPLPVVEPFRVEKIYCGDGERKREREMMGWDITERGMDRDIIERGMDRDIVERDGWR